jgi:rare lipoprotein A
MVGHPYTVAGHTYYPSEKRYAAVGLASWYGDAFHGRRTANGEIFDRDSISAAHPTMPLPSYARVTNLRNHYSMIVRVNDRGPFAPGRIMDVSRKVAEMLDFRRYGTTRVKVEYVGRASLAGSDDHKLVATLRLDGRAAPFNGDYAMPTELAGDQRPVQTASAEPTAAATDAEPTASADRTETQETADASEAPTASTPMFTGTAPLPPSRPFDLATIPGADVPIALRDAQTDR